MHDFTVLLLPDSYGSAVSATLDMLDAAAALAPGLGAPRPRWRVVAPGGGAVRLGNGMTVHAAPLPRQGTVAARRDGSVWVVPGLGMRRAEDLARRLAGDDARQAARALARHAANGGTVAAGCSAVFLLQAAGLLKARRVTTTWWLAAALRGIEPDCTVDADRMVCSDGPVHTAGAAFAQADLMLHLLRLRCGAPLAEAVGRVLLIDGRQAQAPYVMPALMAGGHELIRRLSAHIEAALPTPPGVAALASAFAMSPRTLSRQVRAATGHGTLALVQQVRLHRARALLEGSRLSIEQIAAQVGYEDATALRRLMRKRTGAPPSRFRRAAAAAG